MSRLHLESPWRTYIWWFRYLGKGLRLLLSLSEKSKWPIPIILAPFKINNLQATENRKMRRFRVFRQPRYISLVASRLKKVTNSFPYIQSEMLRAFTA
jgi:hypothetical protein